MIKNIRHTGIVVRNLKKSFNFYKSLGFKKVKKEIEEGKFIETVTGIKNAKISWIKMSADNGAMIELIEYISHPKKNKVKQCDVNKLGCSHIAITTDSINEMAKKIIKNGGSLVNYPEINNCGTVKVAYCYDPEGVLIEIVEELK